MKATAKLTLLNSKREGSNKLSGALETPTSDGGEQLMKDILKKYHHDDGEENLHAIMEKEDFELYKLLKSQIIDVVLVNKYYDEKQSSENANKISAEVRKFQDEIRKELNTIRGSFQDEVKSRTHVNSPLFREFENIFKGKFRSNDIVPYSDVQAILQKLACTVGFHYLAMLVGCYSNLKMQPHQPQSEMEMVESFAFFRAFWTEFGRPKGFLWQRNRSITEYLPQVTAKNR